MKKVIRRGPCKIEKTDEGFLLRLEITNGLGWHFSEKTAKDFVKFFSAHLGLKKSAPKKITPEMKKEAAELRKRKWSYKRIAEKLDVSITTAFNLINS